MIKERTQQQIAFDGVQTLWRKSIVRDSVQTTCISSFDGVVHRPVARKATTKGSQIHLHTRVARMLHSGFGTMDGVRVPKFGY
jgi:hypothetical protein